MRAKYLEDGTITVTGTKGKESFNQVWAGLGWPENEAGYLCVIGGRVDGRYHALWEKIGGLWELGTATVEAKDRFLIDCIWVDARDAVGTAYLRTLPGLCFYETPPKRGLPAATGTHFPAKRGEATATVLPVSERTTNNYRSALEKTRGVIMAGNLLIHEANCPKLVYALRQPLEDLLRSPVVKGLVWVITALEELKGSTDLQVSTSNPWYGNTPRGSLIRV
jgi:hypothetical protein